MKGKELVKLLQKNGWVVDRIHGSHYIMKKDNETEIIPVHRHSKRTIKCNNETERTQIVLSVKGE